MERYIDAELAKEALTGWETDPLDEEIERTIDNIPTADVAPKSEVERLQAEIERLKKDNEYILMQHRFQRRPGGDCWNDVIEKAKTEVAREVLALIWDAFQSTNCYDEFVEKFDEITKKYTEGQI